MNLRVVLKTAFLLFICVDFKVNAEVLESDSLPVLQEWWRAPADIIGLGRSVSFLPNFYNGKDAIVVSVPDPTNPFLPMHFHTWLNRFPGDTQNVFSWKGGNVKSGDFNGDGITDYVDGAGYIYKGIQNGQPPMPEPVARYISGENIFDFNSDGFDDIYAINEDKILYGSTDLTKLVSVNAEFTGMLTQNFTALQNSPGRIQIY
ncbi:MAG TPA: VCBS repeat-containing protein [Patescibacteria group bacterium]|nr:VCBS repeat-containing protein [Patescibacteria group bacterium]